MLNPFSSSVSLIYYLKSVYPSISYFNTSPSILSVHCSFKPQSVAVELLSAFTCLQELVQKQHHGNGLATVIGQRDSLKRINSHAYILFNLGCPSIGFLSLNYWCPILLVPKGLYPPSMSQLSVPGTNYPTFKLKRCS